MRLTITLPEQFDLLERLVAIDNDPHLVTGYYSLLLKAAEHELSGNGLAGLLIVALNEYTKDMDSVAMIAMALRLADFVPALTDDPEVRADTVDRLRLLGYPVD